MNKHIMIESLRSLSYSESKTWSRKVNAFLVIFQFYRITLNPIQIYYDKYTINKKN